MEKNKDKIVVDEKENNNIKEVENLDSNEKESKKVSKFFISFLNWKYIYYVSLIILSLIIEGNLPTLTVTLGDMGSIIPILLNIVSINGLRWIPLLSIIGIVLLIFEKRFKEISKVYIVATGFITVASVLIQFII